MRSIPVKTYFILACLLITAGLRLSAQATDTTLKTVPKKDTVIKAAPKKAFLDDKVDYHADDSLITDLTNKKAYLYNNAVVVYQDMTLQAGYIMIDFKNSIVYAFSTRDSSGKEVQRPVFQNKDGKYIAGSIAYNFETKKGKIKDVITQQDEGYIHGSDIKKDTGNVYYVSHGMYTTCDLEHPHYYIRAKKIKVIPEDKIITGPAMMYIADVPTPLALPFGFFPNKKGRRSGILIPSYGQSTQWGYFLKDAGFYFGGSEYVDLALTGDVYSNGSFGLNARSSYKERYRYDGSALISYSRFINGDRELPNSQTVNNFAVRWSHNQDQKANPNSRFSANVNVANSSYNKYSGSVTNYSSPTGYLSNQLSSNIVYSRNFAGTPFMFSANARHSQNTITKTVDVTLPELNLSMNRIFPFKNLSQSGNHWYDKIGVSATLNAQNSVSSYDSLLFRNETLHQMKNGAQLNVPVTANFNVLKFITFTPGMNFTSMGYLQTVRENYDPETQRIRIDTVPGAAAANTFSTSATLTTHLYGDYYFKTKHLKQIRHVATPSVSFSYRPDFGNAMFGYYKTVQSDSLGHTTQYSIFQNGTYGAPGSGKSGMIAFSLNNTLEAKRKIDSDSGAVFKKVSLIDNFAVSFAYNIAVKSFNWTPVSLTGRTKLFKVLDITASATLNPYQLDSANHVIDKFEWRNGRIGRLTDATISFSSSLRSKDKKQQQPPPPPPPPGNIVKTDPLQDELNFLYTHPNMYVDFSIPWDLGVSYTFSYREPYGPSSAVRQQSVTANGNMSITRDKKWKIQVATGYDMVSRRMTLTNVTVSRDLHCWEMHFTWVPFGFRQSFMLTLNVKASTLKDLKLTRHGGWDYQ